MVETVPLQAMFYRDVITDVDGWAEQPLVWGLGAACASGGYLIVRRRESQGAILRGDPHVCPAVHGE